jgi:membrane protein YqaA with SNARE-associated domain
MVRHKAKRFAPALAMFQGPQLLRLYRILLAIGIITLVGLTNLAAQMGYTPQQLMRYGYLGVFASTLLASGGLVVPVPAVAVIFTSGAFLNPLVVGLVAGLAAALGELTGYLLGYSGQGTSQKSRLYVPAQRWLASHGFATVFVLSLIPNPAFDVAGIAAGALRFPLWQFWLACFLGKSLRCIGIAYLGMQFPLFVR